MRTPLSFQCAFGRAEYVAAGKDKRNGLGRDRCGMNVARRAHGTHKRLRDPLSIIPREVVSRARRVWQSHRWRAARMTVIPRDAANITGACRGGVKKCLMPSISAFSWFKLHRTARRPDTAEAAFPRRRFAIGIGASRARFICQASRQGGVCSYGFYARCRVRTLGRTEAPKTGRVSRRDRMRSPHFGPGIRTANKTAGGRTSRRMPV